MKPSQHLKSLLITLLIAFISSVALAQKQPAIQETSIRAPQNIKIDGFLTEWKGEALAASNPSTRINYTVSNDDNNLYFTMSGLGVRVTTKALNSGVIFTISHGMDKKSRAKAADNVTVTFPLPQTDETVAHIMAATREVNDFYTDIPGHKKVLDSVQVVTNERLPVVLKELKVKGIAAIPDSVLSVYNTEGIKVAAHITVARLWTYELAIPLKYLGLSVANGDKFSYHVILPGLPDHDAAGNPIPGTLRPARIVNGEPVVITNQNDMYLANNTDFWGTYTLIK